MVFSWPSNGLARNGNAHECRERAKLGQRQEMPSHAVPRWQCTGALHNSVAWSSTLAGQLLAKNRLSRSWRAFSFCICGSCDTQYGFVYLGGQALRSGVCGTRRHGAQGVSASSPGRRRKTDRREPPSRGTTLERVSNILAQLVRALTGSCALTRHWTVADSAGGRNRIIRAGGDSSSPQCQHD